MQKAQKLTNVFHNYFRSTKAAFVKLPFPIKFRLSLSFLSLCLRANAFWISFSVTQLPLSVLHSTTRTCQKIKLRIQSSFHKHYQQQSSKRKIGSDLNRMNTSRNAKATLIENDVSRVLKTLPDHERHFTRSSATEKERKMIFAKSFEANKNRKKWCWKDIDVHNVACLGFLSLNAELRYEVKTFQLVWEAEMWK